MDPATEPLLENSGEPAPWGTAANDDKEMFDMDVAELLQHPESVISVIEKFGVACLGQFEIEVVSAWGLRALQHSRGTFGYLCMRN